MNPILFEALAREHLHSFTSLSDKLLLLLAALNKLSKQSHLLFIHVEEKCCSCGQRGSLVFTTMLLRLNSSSYSSNYIYK